MTNEEHKALIQKIVVNINNQAELTSLLSDLSKDYTQLNTEIENFKKQNETLVSDNENLRNTNMKLFLQVGTTEEKAKEEDITPQAQDEQNEEPSKFEDLFTEKGELKNV